MNSLLWLVACSSVDVTPEQDPAPDAVLSEPIQLDEPLSDPPDEVFGLAEVHAASLSLTPADHQALLESGRVERLREKVWVDADLVWDGEPAGRIGIRVKGVSKRKATVGNAFPFKLDFDRVDPERRLHGLKKLNLHSTPVDPTGIREALAYGAWREAGVPAPRTGWVDLTLNGEDLGLYVSVEQIDRTFLRRHFATDDGILYKPASPLEGGRTERRGAQGWLRAGEDPGGARYGRLTDVLSGPVSGWPTEVDVDSMLVHFAGDVALGNGDSYVLNQHNYYLYAPDGTAPFTWIPWDMDRVWTATDLCPEPKNGTRPPWRGIRVDPVLEPRYREAVRAWLAGPASSERLQARADAILAVLGDRVDAYQVGLLRANLGRQEAQLRRALDEGPGCGLPPAGREE